MPGGAPSCCIHSLYAPFIPWCAIFLIPLLTRYICYLFYNLSSSLDPCTYGREDCHGRESCAPIDGAQGVCRCDRFFAFTGASCNEPTTVTYALAPMIAAAVVTSIAVLVVHVSGHFILPL